MEFADMVFPYVALGYTKVDFEFHGSQNDLTESDLSYGIGADVRIGQFQVGLEWIMLQDKSDLRPGKPERIGGLALLSHTRASKTKRAALAALFCGCDFFVIAQRPPV